jgi:hypothetical protein
MRVCVRKLQKLEDDWLSEIASFFEPILPRGSFSLKLVLLVHFKFWYPTKNIRFPMIQICCAILALKSSTVFLIAA